MHAVRDCEVHLERDVDCAANQVGEVRVAPRRSCRGAAFCREGAVESTVAVEGLSQGYGRVVVIRDVSLSLSNGVHGLLGPNGAGKTTLMTTLATVTSPRAGKLLLFGREVRTPADARKARERLGFLPQSFSFAPRFTVQEFLEYAAWTKRVPGATLKRAVDLAIQQLELGDHRNRRLGQLSGGLLQRAGIAQALVNNPSILLLDEPTVGLDPEQRLMFRRILSGLSEITILLSTHLVEDIAATCSRVVVLDRGDIVFDGAIGDLSALGRNGRKPPGSSDLEGGYLHLVSRDRQGGDST